MIISHAHQFIFFAVPKTATHAVREALRVHLKEGDWEQQMLFGEQVLPIPEIAAVKHGHITANEIRPFLDRQQWAYRKIAFVRHPFDRFVSACAFLNRDNPNYESNARQWMKAALQRPQFRQRLLIRPQVEQLCIEGQLVMDFVGRYESLQKSLDSLFDQLGLVSVDLKQRNASQHKHVEHYLDEDLKRDLRTMYEQDFAVFEY